MIPLKWGGSMNEYQEKYVALKKQFEQSKGDSFSVTALYDFKESNCCKRSSGKCI